MSKQDFALRWPIARGAARRTHRPRLIRLRLVASALLLVLAGAWLTTLPRELLQPGAVAAPYDWRQPLLAAPPSPPRHDDLLVLQLRAPDLGVQLLRGVVAWTWGEQQRGQLNFTVLADGRPHWLVLPVGASPGWRGRVRDIRLSFEAETLPIEVGGVRLLRRGPWALDQWLSRLVLPPLPLTPPWPNIVLLAAALLGGGLALAWPRGRLRRRLLIVGVALGSAVGLAALAQQITLAELLARRYGPLDEQALQAQAPSLTYGEAAEVNRALVAAAAALPDGPVLVVDRWPKSYLVYRAQYLLYPRQVDGVIVQELPAVLAQSRYVALIEREPSGGPPLPGWTQLQREPGAPTIWHAPGLPAAAPLPAAGRLALPRLLLGLALVQALGWGLAGLAGWRGGLRLAAAWPLGGAALAWWMFALAQLGLPWQTATIGLPLLLGAALLSRRAGPTSEGWRATRGPAWRWWELAGLGLLGLLVGCVALQAALIPFIDQDTWKMWGLKGRAFYLDGELRRVLAMYRTIEYIHPGYPPAQPLLQSWAYLSMGGISERLVKLVFPIWYAAGLGLIWHACRRWHGRTAALGWTLLLASTPLLLDHAVLGNADLPLGVALLLAALALADWLERGARRALLGGLLALGAVAWLKLDGAYLAPSMLGLAIACRVWMLQRAGSHPGAALRDGLLALAALLALILIWRSFTWQHDLRGDLPGLARLQQQGWSVVRRGLAVIGGEIGLSYNNSPGGFLGGGFGALWLVCGGALLLNLHRLRHDMTLRFWLLFVLGGGAFYLAIYTLRPFFSIERYLLHLAPVALLAAARASMPAPSAAPGGSRP